MAGERGDGRRCVVGWDWDPGAVQTPAEIRDLHVLIGGSETAPVPHGPAPLTPAPLASALHTPAQL